MRKTLIAGLIGSALALGGTAQASLVFDLNGTAAGGEITAMTLDWAPTSFLAMGGNTAIANFINGTGSTEFEVLTHARLTGFTRPDGTLGVMPGGVGEITMVARYTERVFGFVDLGMGSQLARFTSTGTGWLEFYWSPADSLDLTGSGFNNGTLIGRLGGVAIGVNGIFTVDDPTPVPLDGAGPTNDYTGQMSVTGGGTNLALRAGTTSVDLDPNFFKTTLAGFFIQYENISIGLPYGSADPSHCFNPTPSGAAVGTGGQASTCDTDHVNGLFSVQGAETGYTPVIGAVNGFGITIDPTTGKATVVSPDFIAQSDFNSPVKGVPEPGTLALVGLALAGMGGVGAARRRRA